MPDAFPAGDGALVVADGVRVSTAAVGQDTEVLQASPEHALIADAHGELFGLAVGALGAFVIPLGSLERAQLGQGAGLFVREARPLGFGLGRSRPQRNLLLVTFEDRRQAARRFA